MAKDKALPKFVFVSRKRDSDGSTWLSADEQAEREIEDDGPSVVGTYQLVETNKLSKRVVSQKV